ncbi:sirohydrochlorin chelatase, partial [Hyella patelloides]|uniref:sirohydrochlorin chelatase n=1 Tax=Hyella patelloides TaxID=1982969 RepID=UPI00119C999D
MNNNSARLFVFHGSRNQQYSLAISQLANLVKEQLARHLLISPDQRSQQASEGLSLECDSRVYKPRSLEGGVPSSGIEIICDWKQEKTLYTENLKRFKHSQVAQLKTKTTATTRYQSLLPLVEVAVLEFADVPLSQSIINFAQKAIAYHYQKVEIIPVFLSAGVHVREDIPLEIAQAKQKLGDTIVSLELLDYVGNYPQLTALITQKFTQIAAQGRILLAHGSRLSQGNVASEQLAKKVNAINTYWTVQPDLTSAVQLLVKQNISSIAIVPYFLFSGRITEAIAFQV